MTAFQIVMIALCILAAIAIVLFATFVAVLIFVGHVAHKMERDRWGNE